MQSTCTLRQRFLLSHAWLVLGLCLLAASRLSAMEDKLRLPEDGPRGAGIHQLQEKIRQLDAVIQQNEAKLPFLRSPADAEVYVNRGEVYEALGRYVPEIQDYCRRQRCAMPIRSQGEYTAQAGKDYAAAIRVHPGHAKAYNRLGLVDLAASRLNWAAQNFTKAIELNPAYAEAYNNLGRVGARSSSPRALEHYTKAIGLNPAYAEAYYNRGLLYSVLGEHQRALADFTAAIRVNPDYVQAYSSRCAAYNFLRVYERAIADCTEAIRRDRYYAEAYSNRSSAYHSLGQLEQWRADLDTAIRLGQEYPHLVQAQRQ